MQIYQGEFRQGKTRPVGMILYPNGDIYYGQQKNFQKNGVGKLIEITGGFKEGSWE